MVEVKATQEYKRFDNEPGSPTPAITPPDRNVTAEQLLDPSKLILPTIRSSHTNLRYKKAILAFAIIQVIFGITSIASNSTVIAGSIAYSYWLIGLDASGIWGGLISIVAGAFGIAVFRRSSGCRLVAYLVLSTIAAVSAGVGVVFSGYWLPQAQYMANRSYYGGRQATVAPLVGCSVGIVVCAINVIVSISSAAYMCANAACCCCNNGSSLNHAGTIYVAVPMETITEIVSKNVGSNSKVVVMPYKA